MCEQRSELQTRILGFEQINLDFSCKLLAKENEIVESEAARQDEVNTI